MQASKQLHFAATPGTRQQLAAKGIAHSGLLHALLGLTTQRDIEGHPKLGASWEGFLIDQIVQQLGARPEETYFWRTHTGAELDLLVVRGRHRHGFEIKRTTAPVVTPSTRSALSDLKLESLQVVHAGAESFQLAERIWALSSSALVARLNPLR